MTTYLKERELAAIVRKSLSALRQDRSKNVGIPFIKCGRNVLYDPADVQAYIDSRRVATDGGK